MDGENYKLNHTNTECFYFYAAHLNAPRQTDGAVPLKRIHMKERKSI